jgi:hypothetical protein
VTDLRQLIIDRAAAFTEENLAAGCPIRWTPTDLAEEIRDNKWTDGKPHTCDLEEICGTLNHRFKGRRPAHTADPAPVSAEDGDEETTNGTPFLLPIADMPGYFVDPWGRPHADKRTGRKAGPVGLDKFFTSKGRKEKSPRFVCGYRVRVGGKRKRYRLSYFAMARFFAEQRYLNGEV